MITCIERGGAKVGQGGGRKQKGRARVDREPSLPLSPPCPSPAPSCSCLSLCRSRASPSCTLASLLADSDSAILGLGSGIHRGSAAANTVYASRPGARAAVTKQACSRCPSLAALTRRAPSQKGVRRGVLSVSGKEGSTAPSFRPAPGTGAGLAGERSETTARRMDPRLACKRWPSERAAPVATGQTLLRLSAP